MTTIVTGDDVVLPVTLKKNNATFAIGSGATVKAALVSTDHKTVLAGPVTCSALAAGADWSVALVIVTFPSLATAGITAQGPAMLEIQVDDGGKLTWFTEVKIEIGNIAQGKNMSKSTIKLHEVLLRLAKGMLRAWETWLEETKAQTN